MSQRAFAELGAPATTSPARRVRILDERRSDILSGDTPTAVWAEVQRGQLLPIILIDGAWQPIAAFRTPECAGRYLNAGFPRPKHAAASHPRPTQRTSLKDTDTMQSPIESSFTKPVTPAALLGAIKAADDRIEQIPLADITPSPFNPRKTFDGIDELAASIAEQGLLENLVVRPAKKDGQYELIAGERRFRALKQLLRKTATCRILVANDAQARAAQIVENLQREDIGPMDEAEAFKALQDQDAKTWTTQAIATAVGKTDRFVQQRLAIANGLSAPLKKQFADGKLSVEVARTLAPLPASMQAKLKDDYSVKENNANGLRRAITNTAIPVANAAFDLALYTGEFLEEGSKKYFLNIDEFRRLQTIEAGKAVEALKAAWPKAQLIDDPRAWSWADESYAGYGGVEHAERKGNTATKYNVAKEKCTAVVWIAQDGKIRQAQGVCSRAMIDAAATKRAAARNTPSTKPPSKLLVEAKASKTARLAFNKRLQDTIAKDDNMLARLHLLHLLCDDYPCPMEATDSAHLPKELKVDATDLYDDEGVAEAWAAIVKLPIASVRLAIRKTLASSVEWPEHSWEKAPGYLSAVASSVGLTVPVIAEEKPAAKAKPAAKKAATSRKKL